MVEKASAMVVVVVAEAAMVLKRILRIINREQTEVRICQYCQALEPEMGSMRLAMELERNTSLEVQLR